MNQQPKKPEKELLYTVKEKLPDGKVVLRKVFKQIKQIKKNEKNKS